ncbi:hypothetical protein F2Q68_00020388 [Brassica cretica]|uniref:EXS domain-containing protein n=1 Tax=Brassica cretica TaxID=69181 RepID=A0A8S9FVA4_BRACR|nr:hypothetical protein F2Q68_00020388 [Brassica cretica]
MKFGKEFSSQMVPEWHEAYMDYEYLKSLLKDITKFKRKNNPHGQHLRRKSTVYRTFSGLLSKSGRRRHPHGGAPISPFSESDDDIEEGLKTAPILVHSASHGYETTFLMAAEAGGEYETVFFRRLDDEFNKVEKFYKEKVDEVMKEAVMLNKQMDALIAFRVKVEHPDGWPWKERTVEMTRLASDVDISTAAVAASTPAGARSNQLTSQVQALRSVQFYICHYGWGDYKLRQNTCTDSDTYNAFLFIVAVVPYVCRLLQCLRRLFEEKNAEQGYNGIKYFLTIVAVCLRTAYSVDKDNQFVWRMLAGIFSAIAAIFCTYWDLVLDWGLLNRTSKNRWLRDKLLIPQKKVYFIAMILNVLLRFAWVQTVLDFNFSFMHRQTMVAVVASLEIIRRGIWNFFRLENEHLNNVGKYRAFKTCQMLQLNSSTWSKKKTRLYNSRAIKIKEEMLISGLVRAFTKLVVTLPDFLLGDQLTSQVQALRSVQFYICHYGWGDYKLRQNTCTDSDTYNAFLFIVAVVPYVCRLLQCLRRLFEEKNAEQGYNGIKYFLTIVAVCLRTAYSVDKDNQFVWRMLAGIFSAIAAIFCTYWDLVLDWGLLNRTSKNRWLRDKLLIPQKKVYFIAMILNVLLRFAWVQTVLDFNFSFMHKQTMVAVVASLEIIRRGIWNFFRLENEHLNNVGKYRAFKTVPLPFNYDEDDDKDN